MRRFKLLTAIPLITLLILQLNLGAQTKITPYLSLSGGYTIMEDSDISVQSYEIGQQSFDDGFIAEGAIGFEFDQGTGIFPVRTELALSFQRNDLDKFSDKTVILGSIPTPDDEVDIVALMANLYLDIPTKTPLTPYLMVGAGGANIDLSGEDDTLFAGQVGAGLGYTVNEHLVLDFKYRYFFTEDAEFTYAFEEVEAKIASHQFLFGARYMF